jgi:hypothetical protein
MLRRVPAPAGEVDASSKGQLSVNGQDFLVLASARRMDVVGLEMDARVFERVLSEHKLRIANVCEQDGKLPREDKDVQLRILRDKAAQKVPQRACILPGIIFIKLRAGIQIPGEQGDPALRPSDGFNNGSIVSGGVDQQREAVRFFYAPAIVPWLQNGGHGFLQALSVAPFGGLANRTKLPGRMPEVHSAPSAGSRSYQFTLHAEDDEHSRSIQQAVE